MFRFLKKITGFAALLALVQIGFFQFHTNEKAYRTEAYRNGVFNTLFIGSSRTKCSVNAAHFDQISGGSTASYNFGLNLGLPPATFEHAEELINTSPSVRSVIIELSGSSAFDVPEEKRLLFEIYNYVTGLKLRDVSEYLDHAGLSLFKPIIPKRDKKIVEFDMPCQVGNNVPNAAIENGKLKDADIQKAFDRSELLEKRAADESSINTEYWNRITQFVDSANAKGVEVYFFVPPRIEGDREMEMILTIYRKLAKKNKLENAHNEKGLYTIETSMDSYHLNTAGSLIFTRILAEQFAKKEAER